MSRAEEAPFPKLEWALGHGVSSENIIAPYFNVHRSKKFKRHVCCFGFAFAGSPTDTGNMVLGRSAFTLIWFRPPTIMVLR